MTTSYLLSGPSLGSARTRKRVSRRLAFAVSVAKWCSACKYRSGYSLQNVGVGS